MVGLDLSGFSTSPCIHSFPCLFYLLELSWSPQCAFIHPLQFWYSQKLLPFVVYTTTSVLFSNLAVSKQNCYAKGGKCFSLGRTYRSQTQHMLLDSIPNQCIRYSYQFHLNIILTQQFRSTKIQRVMITNKYVSFSRSSPRMILNDETGSSPGMWDRKRGDQEPTGYLLKGTS
jgi:hypothetical protein